MRLNDDGKTVAAMDVLVPKVGELIGGSQREERLDVSSLSNNNARIHYEDTLVVATFLVAHACLQQTWFGKEQNGGHSPVILASELQALTQATDAWLRR